MCPNPFKQESPLQTAAVKIDPPSVRVTSRPVRKATNVRVGADASTESRSGSGSGVSNSSRQTTASTGIRLSAGTGVLV